MATIGKKAIATTASPHFAPGPLPATSLAPPTPPAGPVPAPFAYLSRSRTADSTASGLKVGGAEVLVSGSRMDVDVPGNLPCLSTGGDIVTAQVDNSCNVLTGSMKVLAGGAQVACTGDMAHLNTPPNAQSPAQVDGMLLMAATIQMALVGGGSASVVVVLDPISVTSGDVVDQNVDLEITGLIPLRWAVASLLTGIGSTAHDRPDIEVIRDESAALVEHRGGHWQRG